MRKIFASVIAITLILSSFSLVAFAADSNVYFGDGSGSIVATDDTVTLSLYLDKDDEDIATYGIGNLEFTYDVTDATVVPATNDALKSSFTLAFGIDTKDKKLVYTAADSYIPSKVTELATFVVTRVGDVATSKITLGDVILTDSTGFAYTATSKGITITWPSSAPATPEVKDVTTTATGTTFGNYKDVPLFNCGATVSGATADTKIFIEPELFLDSVSNGTRAKTEIPGLTIDGEGKVVIRIAIVGAPEGVVTINPNITAE